MTGNRKLIVFLTTLVITALLAFFSKVDGGIYQAIVIAGFALFTAGNAAEHYTKK